MVVIALVLRLGFLWVQRTDRFTEQRNHFGFGFETGSIAGDLARGEGFSSPFGVPNTGPTAWVAPIYPYLVALVFKVFGIFSPAAAVVVLAINSMITLVALISPWLVRNRIVFGKRVFLRSNAGFEFCLGNLGGAPE